MLLQRRNGLRRDFAKFFSLRRIACKDEDSLFVKSCRAAILQDGGFQNRRRGFTQGLLSRLHDPRNVCDPGDRIPDVDFFRKRRLRQQRIHAVADVVAIGARIFFERSCVLRQPDVASQLITQNLKIDLPVAGQFAVRHFHRQKFQSSSILFQPCLASFRTDVVQLMIKAMIAQHRGFERSHKE